MASVIDLSGGRKRIEFYNADGKRQAIYLGKMSRKGADKIKTKIEELHNAAVGGTPLENETAIWLANRPDKFYAKLAKYGLVKERKAKSTALLGDFIDEYVQKQTHVKSSTKEIWRQGKKGLIDFLG